jgi:hypothetical protein
MVHPVLRGALVGAATVLAACGGGDDPVGGASDDIVTGQCVQALDCRAPAFAPGPKRPWRNSIKSALITGQGPANHRGRDLLLTPDEPQNVIVQLAYGITKAAFNMDLVDEEVDIHVQRGCDKGWEKLGSAISTSSDTHHPPVEGVEDHGGRVYFPIPAGKRLGPGVHRIRVVVAGDGTSTDLTIAVAPRNTPIFVTDIDGTLTASETDEYIKLLTDDVSQVHPGAPEALNALADKGYLPVYLTARPEWVTKRTHELIEARGLPPGIVRTSLKTLGAGFGASAAAYKSDELAQLARRGFTPRYAFGNTSSDDEAYAKVIPDPDRRFLFKLDGATGRRIDAYTTIVPELQKLPDACK